MTISLDRLPFDILFYVASNLDLDDIVHLSQTCRQLRLLLEESTLCRKTIEAHAPHSKEAQLARRQEMTYNQALRSIYDRRDAFSNAYPFSARTIGQGTAFTYRQGVLCILNGSVIRISDIHASSESYGIDVFDLLTQPCSNSSKGSRFSLLYYSDGILAVHYEGNEKPNNGRILALKINADTPTRGKLIKNIPLGSSYKLFVRHNASYLYYGTYTGAGDHGHHEWEIRRISLDANNPLPPYAKPVQLEEFFGTDVGSTITFDIHNGYFYAISNQTSFDVEELDWTSFYHCIRFPLDRPEWEAPEINPRVYRRQHAEGPIHDSWTDLTIQVDECTDEPVIVESRREWQKGSSRQLRTFYISKINFDPPTPSADGSPDLGVTVAPMLPDDDPFTGLLDSSNRPNYAPTQERLSWNFHREFGNDGKTYRSFILARTKFRAYNYSCSSFIDLVEDERCCRDPTAEPCLRIRVGSRRLAPTYWSPFDKAELSSLGKSVDPPDYRHSSIKMWPAPASQCPCARRLHDILNPRIGSGLGNRSITAAVDERSLIYMVKAGRSYSADDNTLGTIVLVNFNREMRGPSSAKPAIDSPVCSAEEIKDQFTPSHWQWTPGHYALCQKGKCR